MLCGERLPSSDFPEGFTPASAHEKTDTETMATRGNGLLEDFHTVMRGFLMGGADIIPGVSGGTVALILGIYERLVTAISHVDTQLFDLLRRGEWRSAGIYLDVRFLATLGLGIGSGIVSLAGLMHYLLLEHHMLTLAAFFGLIAASSWLVARIVKTWHAAEFCGFAGGCGFAFWLVGLPLFQHPPAGPGYIFFCGLVAICAMILPGISGAFILLLLGKYAEITGLIKGLAHGSVTLEGLLTMLTFAAGCLVGLIGFSKLLKILLVRYETATMAVLGGFMAGSLRKLWPFQRDLTPETIDLKHKLYESLSLDQVAFLQELLPACLVALFAAAAVLWLERWAKVSRKAQALEQTLEH